MNTCKTCKFWTRTEPEDVYKNGTGLYPETRNSHIPEWEAARQFVAEHGVAFHGDCHNEAFVYGPIPTQANQLAYQDSERYFAHFATGQDFGCIHHQPKE